MGDSNEEYNGALNIKHKKIQDDLKELQVVETYLFDELSKVNQGDSTRTDQQEQITSYIENLKNVRTTLMENLKNLYTNANNDLNYNSQHLSNQRDMSGQLKLELDKAREVLKKLKAERIVRAKINLYTNTGKQIQSAYHIDNEKESVKVGIYCVNSNNGYTQFKTGEKAPSLENSMILFNANELHKAVTQTDTKTRINININ